MAEGLFLMGKIKANAVSGIRHIRASGARHKMIAGSIIALALFGVPFAVQAALDSYSQPARIDTDQHQVQPIEYKDKTGPKKEAKRTNNITNDSNIEIQTNTNSSSGQPDGEGEVDVTINGQKIPVPGNGHVHKTIKNNKNQTVVDVQIENESSSSNVHSSTSVEINAQSSSGSRDADNCNRLTVCR